MAKEGPRRAGGVAALIAALVALGLLAWVALAAASTRYWADDYCYASMERQHGLLGAQASWYHDWTGRFTATAVMSALTSLPVRVAAWSLPLLLAAWVATLAWSLLQAGPAGRQQPRVLAVAVAAAVVAATVAIVPTRAQEIDWLTGAVTYVLPLVLATPIAGLIVRAARGGGAGTGSMALAAGLAALAAGCSESFTGTELAGLTLVAVASMLPGRLRPARRVAVAALVGGLVGLAVVMLAPGNANRVAALHTHGWVGNLVGPTLHFSAQVVTTYIGLTPVPLLLAVLVGAAAALALPWPVTVQRPAATVLAALLVGAVMVYGAMAPAIYYSAQPPDRALLGTAELVVLGAVGLGFVVGSALRSQHRALGALALATASVLLVVTYPAQAAPLDDLHSAGWTASAWDRRDATIRMAAAVGRASVAVPRLTSGALVDDLQVADVQTCAQSYYGVQITVR
jgi:hypothetical protein